MPYSIGSALRQTFFDFEVLVVGDGCTDDSEAVVGAVGDGRVRWINLPVNNGHQSAPNNEGLRQARGEYIAYLGHDDLWLPHHLSCLVAALEAGADLAFGVTERVFPGKGPKRYAPDKPGYAPGDWLPPTGIAHRRRVTESVGGWADYRALTVSPEIDLWRRAYEHGYKFVFVPRLTAIKFPASKRPGVYRETPHHEQAEWFGRIGREGDLEAVELAGLLLASAVKLRGLSERTPEAYVRAVRQLSEHYPKSAALRADRRNPLANPIILPREPRPVTTPAWDEKLYPKMIRDFLSETGRRIRRRLVGMVRRPPPAHRKGEDVEAVRLLKGLRPKL